MSRENELHPAYQAYTGTGRYAEQPPATMPRATYGQRTAPAGSAEERAEQRQQSRSSTPPADLLQRQRALIKGLRQ